MGIRDSILSADDLPRTAVATPEWPEVNGSLFIRTMTRAERDEYETLVYSKQNGNGKPRDLKGMKSLLVMLTCVDASGTRIFGDDDRAALEEKSACALNRLAAAALSQSGFTISDIEELEKN